MPVLQQEVTVDVGDHPTTSQMDTVEGYYARHPVTPSLSAPGGESVDTERYNVQTDLYLHTFDKYFVNPPGSLLQNVTWSG